MTEESRTVGRDDVTRTGDELIDCLGEVLNSFERDGHTCDLGAFLDVLLSGCTSVGANNCAIDVSKATFDREAWETCWIAHDLLTVVERRLYEVLCEVGVTSLGPCCIADEYVDLT